MPTNLKGLLETRAELGNEIARMNKLNEQEGRKWTAEDETAWGKVNADYDENERKITMAQRAEKVEAAQTPGKEDREGDPLAGMQKTEITERHRDLAMNAWARSQFNQGPNEEEAEACKLLRFNPNTRELAFNLLPDDQRKQLQRKFQATHPSRQLDIQLESRTLSNFIPGSGAYLRPSETFIRNLEVNMLAFGGMEQVAEVITTSTGERLAWPTADDTSNTGVQLGENTSIGSSVDPSFSQMYLDAYKFSSKTVLVPSELIQDSAFDISGLISGMLGERLGRISNTKFTTGSGANTVKGIMNCTSLGVTTAGATAITCDEVLNLVHSIDPAYRSGSRFMFHDGVLLYLRKLKDNDGKYLWQQGVGDAPATLWGFPYTINQDMQSTVASATKTMIFGQLSKYKIRRAGGIRLVVMNERHADTDQRGFVAFIRQDGNLLNAGTAPVKHMLQA